MEIFFEEENRKGRACVDLYELVQHAGNIVPRLWVGSTVLLVPTGVHCTTHCSAWLSRGWPNILPSIEWCEHNRPWASIDLYNTGTACGEGSMWNTIRRLWVDEHCLKRQCLSDCNIHWILSSVHDIQWILSSVHDIQWILSTVQRDVSKGTLWVCVGLHKCTACCLQTCTAHCDCVVYDSV